MNKIILALLLSATTAFGQAWGYVLLEELEEDSLGLPPTYKVLPTNADSMGAFLMSLYLIADSVTYENYGDENWYIEQELYFSEWFIESAYVGFRREYAFPLILLRERE